MIRTTVFSPAKKMVLIQLFSFNSIFCCSVSVVNISLHFQTIILSLIVIIQWYFCLTTASAPHRDLIRSSSSLSEWDEETQQTETTSPRRFKKSPCKPPWNTIHKSTESYSCFKRKGNFAVFEVIKLTASLLGERCWSFTHTISLSLYITSNPSICPSIYLWIIPYIWLIIHCFILYVH